MVVFKKAIPRRTVLRGIGVSLALPLLDAMTPAFAGPADAVKPPSRLGIIYSPNGMWPMNQWTPKTEGTGFETTPIIEPLKPFRDQMLIVSGLSNREALPRPGDDIEGHALSLSTWLTGIRPHRTASKDLQLGATMDQIAARELGKTTQLGSLEVSLLSHTLTGTTYLSTLSWRGPSTPLPMEYNPRAVFERMFGDNDTTDPKARRTQMSEDGSILDLVGEDANQFSKKLGQSDRAKMSQYLDAIRDVERQISTAKEQSSREIPLFSRPAGVPESLTEYSKIMTDLQVLAFQCDLTRVTSFMLGREGPDGSRAYPEIGIADTHHSLSHHQDNAEKIDKLAKIATYHSKLVAYHFEKLRSVKEGDGNLLDNSIILYGSAMSNGNGHIPLDLPLMLVGGGGGKLKGGRNLKYPEGTHASNLHLAILDRLGVPLDHLGDSNGELDLLPV
jgi:hypothetical protein